MTTPRRSFEQPNADNGQANRVVDAPALRRAITESTAYDDAFRTNINDLSLRGDSRDSSTTPSAKPLVPPAHAWRTLFSQEIAHDWVLELQLMLMTISTGILDATTFSTFSVFATKQTGKSTKPLTRESADRGKADSRQATHSSSLYTRSAIHHSAQKSRRTSLPQYRCSSWGPLSSAIYLDTCTKNGEHGYSPQTFSRRHCCSPLLRSVIGDRIQRQGRQHWESSPLRALLQVARSSAL